MYLPFNMIHFGANHKHYKQLEIPYQIVAFDHDCHPYSKTDNLRLEHVHPSMQN